MSNPGWRKVALRDLVASANAGASVNSEDRPRGAGEIGVLKTSAVSDGNFYAEENKTVLARDRRRVSEPVLAGSVLFSRMNTPQLVGECCYVKKGDSTLFLPDRLWQIRVEPAEVDPRWLAYALRDPSNAVAIKALATGTSGSMKNIAKSSLLAMEVLVPPLSEQAKIADILDTMEDRLRIIERIIQKCHLGQEGLLRRLMTAGVDYEATRSKIGELADTYAGGTPSRSVPAFYGGGIPWVKSGEVNRKAIDWTEETVSPAALQASSIRWVPAQTPLVAMYGATAGVVSWTRMPVTTNQAVLAVVPRSREVYGRWLFWALLFSSSKMLATVQGSGQPNLSKKIIDRFLVPTPKTADQYRIAEILDAAEKRLESELKVLQKLRAEKAGLMADLLTGRVRVRARTVQ